MKKEDKQKVKTEIQAQIMTTKETITSLQESLKPIPHDVSLGRLTRMEAINSKKMDEAALRKAKKKLDQLESSLKHIDDDDFGICSSCGNSIPVGRILMMPETTTCVNCAD